MNCPECDCALIVDGDVIGCPHFDRDDLIEYSGKLMSDGIAQDKADQMAIEAIHNAARIGRQRDLF